MPYGDPDRVCKALGKRIAELRRTRKLTQSDLAERLRVTLRRVQQFEAGENVTVWTLVRLADALDCSLGDLFGQAERAPRRKRAP